MVLCRLRIYGTGRGLVDDAPAKVGLHVQSNSVKSWISSTSLDLQAGHIGPRLSFNSPPQRSQMPAFRSVNGSRGSGLMLSQLLHRYSMKLKPPPQLDLNPLPHFLHLYIPSDTIVTASSPSGVLGHFDRPGASGGDRINISNGPVATTSRCAPDPAVTLNPEPCSKLAGTTSCSSACCDKR